jgi:uncharacterized protein YcbX
MQLSRIFIYPVKSLGGIELSSAKVTDRGFEYDRRWMLIDDDNLFMSQRTNPGMALLQTELIGDGLKVRHKTSGESFTVPFQTSGDALEVSIWDDVCRAIAVHPEADAWFSRMLERVCRLVYMPPDSRRPVDPRYATRGEITSFSDAYPFLMLGQASLDDLNARLEEPLPVNRFRPNLVFTGGKPYQEDHMQHFICGGIHFYGVKPCARCAITTINQETAEQGKEPLKTLARYRGNDHKVFFGQNLLHTGEGWLKVGDRLELLEEA